jgi:hypothetical protein
MRRQAGADEDDKVKAIETHLDYLEVVLDPFVARRPPEWVELNTARVKEAQ